MAALRPVFTLIGDVIASRQTSDRRLLQQHLVGLLETFDRKLAAGGE